MLNVIRLIESLVIGWRIDKVPTGVGSLVNLLNDWADLISISGDE
jgi:hypothetical protein